MYSNGASGGSNLDMCGKCSNNSREALHKRSSTEGKFEENFGLALYNSLIIKFKYSCNINVSYIDKSHILMNILASSGEKVRNKKKDSPPKSSSKTRQGSNRKKVKLDFNNCKTIFDSKQGK